MSAQVGSAHIAIFPVMKGFKSRVRRDVKSAGTSSASDFEASMKGAGRAAGSRIGRDLKTAVEVSTNGIGAGALKNLHRDVSTASVALSKARLKQQDEAGKVRVAETRLQEAVAKSGEGSSQAVAAEERLASARRSQAAATTAVAAATTRLKNAQAEVARANAKGLGETAKWSAGLKDFASNLRAGYGDARAAQSAFTGIGGSLGGIAKEIVVLGRNTSLGRWASLQAQEVSKRFTSLATSVGGGLAKTLTTARSKMSALGSYVGSAFSPMAQYASAAAVRVSSPFVRLGSQVSSWMSPVARQVSGLFSKIGASAGPAAARLTSGFTGGLSGLGSAAGSALQSVVGAAQRVGSDAGRALGAGLKGAATVGVTAAAAAIGVALSAGFSRLSSLDTARAKLTGLGHDGQSVAKIMQNANASVKGTAFGLGEAATVASGAVAAQIKPGKQLETHLKRVANNASAAGVTMDEMGSIFNKAATQANGVQNDVIGQLADKGIPIYQELGKQLGVTSGEVFKMASEGKIDFETFSKAAEAAAGTVAEEMGKTVPGAFKNLRASLGRIGANLFGGINKETGEMYGLYAKLGPLLASVTKALGPVEGLASRLGTLLDSKLGPGLERVTEFFDKLGSDGENAGGALSGLSGLLAPLGAGFAALGAGGLASAISGSRLLGPLLGGLTGPLSMLGGPLGIAAAAFAAFALSGADAEGLVDGVTSVVDKIVAALPGFVAKIAEFVPGLVESILAQVPALLEAGVAIVGALVNGLVTALPVIVEGAVALVGGLIAAITGNLPLIIEGAVSLVGALVDGLITALPLIVQGAVQLVSGLLTAIVAALPMIIQGGVQLLMSLVTGLVSALPMLLQSALALVTGLLTAIIENLPLLIEAGIQLLLSLVTGLIDALPQLITAAIELVLQLVAGLLQMLPQLIEAGIQLVVSLIVGLVQAIPQIIEMLPQIVSAIWDGLANVDWLDLGMSIIQGIIDGIISMADSVGNAIGDIVGGILDFFPHSPAKKGPLGPTGWRALKTSGRAMMTQFNDGAAAEAPGIADAMTATANAASLRAQNVLRAASAELNVSATSGGAGKKEVVVQQHNEFSHMDPEVAVELSKQRLAFMVGNAG